jgi:hypothetical protein
LGHQIQHTSFCSSLPHLEVDQFVDGPDEHFLIEQGNELTEKEQIYLQMILLVLGCPLVVIAGSQSCLHLELTLHPMQQNHHQVSAVPTVEVGAGQLTPKKSR